MLLPRILTALVGIPLVAFLIHLGSIPFMAFVLVVTALALYEYALILEIGRLPVAKWTVLLGGLLVAAGLSLGTPRLGPSGNALAAACLSLAVSWAVIEEMFRSDRTLDRPAFSVFGILFVGWTLPHLYLLRELRPHGLALTWLLILSVWVMDTAAYFTGKAIGKHKLSPISPKKTVEGFVAALLAAAAVALIVRAVALKDVMGVGHALAMGLGIGVLGQLSDLGESMVKRAAGVKESGYILPGHGGVLDRFDSFLLAGPFMYYISAFKWL